MVTTEDNNKKRLYIIGKAKELKTRLSPYNKTAERYKFSKENLEPTL